MFGLMYKRGPTIMQRIRRALQGRVIAGRHAIAARSWATSSRWMTTNTSTTSSTP
jgi:hypothetical protein